MLGILSDLSSRVPHDSRHTHGHWHDPTWWWNERRERNEMRKTRPWVIDLEVVLYLLWEWKLLPHDAIRRLPLGVMSYTIDVRRTPSARAYTLGIVDVLERSSLEDRMRAWIQRIPGADRLTHRSNLRICGGRSKVLGKRRSFKLPVKPASVRSNLTNLTLDAQPHPTLRIRRKRGPLVPWLVVAVIRLLGSFAIADSWLNIKNPIPI